MATGWNPITKDAKLDIYISEFNTAGLSKEFLTAFTVSE